MINSITTVLKTTHYFTVIIIFNKVILWTEIMLTKNPNRNTNNRTKILK